MARSSVAHVVSMYYLIGDSCLMTTGCVALANWCSLIGNDCLLLAGTYLDLSAHWLVMAGEHQR